MARTDFRTPRLHVAAALAEGAAIALSSEQANYLVNVLRLASGARVLIFNGRDGEFESALAGVSRKGASLTIGARIREQEAPPDVEFLFAPLKHARLDYVAQKAVEMGASRLSPVVTRRTQAGRLNLERLEANAIEACEQCGILWIPAVTPLRPLDKTLADWPGDRLLVFCDEDAPPESPLDALAAASGDGVSLLIGPEGGFDDGERRAILALPRVVRLNLGPRILRADTAAVAALALIQISHGDWPKTTTHKG